MKTLFKQEYLFWILQIFGWSSLHILSFRVDEGYTMKFEGFSLIAMLFSAIPATSLFRYYIKRKRLFNLSIYQVILVLLLGTLCVILISNVLVYIINGFAIRFFSMEDEFVKKHGGYLEWKNLSTMIVGNLFIYFSWTFLYVFIKSIIKINKGRIERLQLTNSLRDAQLNTLKGQINPHFMFNSLNNIRGLMLEDVDRSRDMITKLADMLRYSLTKNGNDAILLEEELEMVDYYIELSKVQMEDRLQFVKQIEKGLEDILVPPMLIQLLVENAAKHGIAKLEEGGIIALSIFKENKILIIEVRNTGKLCVSENSTHLGLENIKQRLRLIYGDKASFSLNESNNQVIAQIKINEL